MKINREDLLNALELVKAGLSPREFIEQSSCFVFQDGHVMTFNDEVACRMKVDVDFTGAVQAAPLLALLEKLDDVDLEVAENDAGELEFVGKRKRFGITRDAEIFLPIDKVDVAEKWRELPKEFTEAVGLVTHCVSSDESRFLLTCIHLHPDHIEACQPTGTLVRTSKGDVPIESIKVGSRVWSYSQQVIGKDHRRLIGRPKSGHNQWSKGSLVVDTHSREFSGELVCLRAGRKISKYTPDHECLIRVGDCFKGVYLVYLQQKGDRFRVGMTGPKNWKSKALKVSHLNGSADIRERFNTEQADKCWVLRRCATMEEARWYEKLVCAKYGIPDMAFVAASDVNNKGGQSYYDGFWSLFGSNIPGGISCLEAFGRDPQYPFIDRSREKVWMTPSKEMRVRACNLLDGMKVLDADLYCAQGGVGVCEKAWVPINLCRETYSGLVHSMTVQHSHTYVGDGVVTHNCDNLQIMRCDVATGLKNSVLVRGTSLVHITSLGMDQIALTKSWVHFKNQQGLIFSCRRYSEEYPDLTKLISFKGHPIVIPKGLAGASERAAVFAADKAGDALVQVTVADSKIRIMGRGVTGWYREVKKIAYDGPALEFVIAPELLKHISEKYSDAEISPSKLKVVGGGWEYVTVLGPKPTVEEKPDAEEPPKKKKKDSGRDET